MRKRIYGIVFCLELKLSLHLRRKRKHHEQAEDGRYVFHNVFQFVHKVKLNMATKKIINNNNI